MFLFKELVKHLMNSFNIYSLLLTILYKKKVNNLFTNNLQFNHKKKLQFIYKTKKINNLFTKNLQFIYKDPIYKQSMYKTTPYSPCIYTKESLTQSLLLHQ